MMSTKKTEILNVQNLSTKETELPGMIDSHFHILELIKKGVNIQEMLNICWKRHYDFLLDIGVDFQNIFTRRILSGQNPKLFLASGLCPSIASVIEKKPELQKKYLQILEEFLLFEKTIGLGEIGLDWYWKYGTPAIQIQLFQNQLKIAEELGLPVIIHCRDAYEVLIQQLKKTKFKQRGIIHCFSGDLNFALQLLELGFIISFAGNLTFKNSSNLHDTVKAIPLDCLLVETDSPYLAPVPKRGEINTPLNIFFIYDFISKIKEVEIDRVIISVKNNFKDLFPKLRQYSKEAEA